MRLWKEKEGAWAVTPSHGHEVAPLQRHYLSSYFSHCFLSVQSLSHTRVLNEDRPRPVRARFPKDNQCKCTAGPAASFQRHRPALAAHLEIISKGRVYSGEMARWRGTQWTENLRHSRCSRGYDWSQINLIHR